MSACRSCQQPIQWGRTAAGKAMPLDLESVDPRNDFVQVVVSRDGPSTLEVRSLKQSIEHVAEHDAVSTREAEERIVDGYDAFVSHFATCPHAHEHRRHP